MNLAPVRGSYLESCCGASPANDMRPLQGQQRELMSCGGDRGKPLSWNMSPFQGQRCNLLGLQPAKAAQKIVPLTLRAK